MILEFFLRHGLKPVLLGLVVVLCVKVSPFIFKEDSDSFEEEFVQNQSLGERVESSAPVVTSAEQIATFSTNDSLEVSDPSAPAVTAESPTESAQNETDYDQTDEEASDNHLWPVEEIKDEPAVPVVTFVSKTEAESIDFNRWAFAFFPQGPLMSPKELFLKIVGARVQPVCTQPPDPLDYSAGWQQRSILYLYQSNKTRLHCDSYNHSSIPKLEIIDGYQLQDHLNATIGKKLCTVVFFFSGSCPYCRRAAPLMHSAAVYFPALRFLAINTDKSPGVAGHYGIMGVPVVVLFQEKRFLTGWTVPYPDARDTIRAFIMAYTDAKYISHSMNITGLEEGILSHFDLEKHPSFIYMLSNIIVLTSFVMILWKKYLVDLIKRSLDQAGVSDERLVLAVQQPHPQGEPVMPVLEIPAELQ